MTRITCIQYIQRCKQPTRCNNAPILLPTGATGQQQYRCSVPKLYVCMYVCRFLNVVLHCPTPRLHCFLSSHWPSFRFFSFMAFLIPYIQFFFGLSRALFCFGNQICIQLKSAPEDGRVCRPKHVEQIQIDQ